MLPSLGGRQRAEPPPAPPDEMDMPRPGTAPAAPEPKMGYRPWVSHLLCNLVLVQQFLRRLFRNWN
jgi:hypothetical protein